MLKFIESKRRRENKKMIEITGWNIEIETYFKKIINKALNTT